MAKLSTTASRSIDKINARVFCQLQGGGNPVTIFASRPSADAAKSASTPAAPSFFLSNATQRLLAQSCQWESVMVDRHLGQMSFFLPTGEPVSFCAHAAMGGALPLGGWSPAPLNTSTTTTSTSSSSICNTVVVNFTTTSLQSNDNNTNTPYKAVLHEHDIVSLDMSHTVWEESPIAVPPTLYRILRDKIGLAGNDLSPLAINTVLPTFCNASIARPKTLVHVPSMPTLHQKARAPSIESDSFRVACDAIESTGIYLYTQREVDSEDRVHDNNSSSNEAAVYSSWECRQFPRASGYPEDPATGIAAAALAASIDHRRRRHFLAENNNSDNLDAAATGLSISPRYKIYQGTAMGQASLIMVENLQWDVDEESSLSSNVNKMKSVVSFQLVGRVEVDSHETITIDNEEG